ncbi:hypothetical protein [Sphingomonas corticis]|uniref:Uncharacterized protein n=1 Tax=Sphingomonas corticis TaxID=2722791 RepID=A0ABX1CVZ1_9SPHN|nr:hypothetical protein [Sphingomonas corticis]NJR80087.1 hypothetical protein [Sphingomonas corticis]
MNDVSYDIQVERERDLVLMSLAGFFGPSDVEGFRALRRLAFAQLRCPPRVRTH